MAGLKWSDEELKYAAKRAKEGAHPSEISTELNRKYGTIRTYSSVQQKLHFEGMKVPYGPLKKPTLPDPNAEDFTLQLKHTRLKKEHEIVLKRYKQVVEALADQEAMIESIADRVSILPPAPFVKPKTKEKKSSTETVLALFSDAHAGERIDPREIYGLNDYNFDILNLRTKLWANKVIDIPTRKLVPKFDKIVIGMLGDMVSGIIHEELLRGTTGNITDWTVDYAYIVAQALREIASVYKKVDVCCVVGNHGRLDKKPVFKAKYANWDYMLYKHIELHLRNQKNITFEIPRSFWIIKEIEGWRFLFLHGDNIKGWQGVPWYGINRAIAQLKEVLEAAEDHFHYMCLGHFHSLATLDRAKGGTIINGSIKGIDEYSIGKLFTGNRAKQFICGVHPRWGKTWSYDIDLQDARKLLDKGYEYPQI
jgi:hypothetical protein